MKILISLIFMIAILGANQINGAGASFPANVYMSWVKEYQKATSIKVNYQSIGSGGGVKQIKANTIDFGATDEALDKKELQDSNLIQFPTLSGAIVVAYNLDGINDGELKLSNEAIAGIFLGKITKWNDKIIAKDNPNLSLPDLEISIIHRSDGSGTTYNFTSYLSQISKEWNDNIGYGKAISWPKGVGGKGNEGVSHLIKSIKGAIGYTELSYKNNLKLSAAKLQTKSGNWVEANMQTIAEANKNAKWDKDTFSANLLLGDGANSYPIVSATYILIPKDSKIKLDIVKFFEYCFDNGDKSALRMEIAPLPKEVKEQIKIFLQTQ
ncbi:phosphate ABC transporter substrate-binding protein PstS [Helicobacter sp. 16-1353]|uniref:phosphate ABC transporter substrate-binding protein PstS n=1 Tax=Helicobacter sp. 16-1353 TaxID=2004996 RepID=UPI000DCEAC6D|nr:phosphate ABC transporter substrate-binding protein PstS [Helicobacter sp. 16-1353]RAX54257.1 phosphate ABC transporter substrate-binding protein PstS [Helicobacter sp. 16-1353]